MNDHVKTAIRWRPAAQNREVSIEKVNANIVSIGPQFRTYLFDHVFDSAAASDSQAEVYSVLVKPMIARAFEGYDCTFLAIGQTGSGKTYTVGFDQSVNPEHSGMTARVLQSIFAYQNAEQVKVLISFIEIYNEQAFDLLAENQQEPFYNKENRFAEPTKISIKTEHDVPSLLAQASKRRHIRNTKMNSASSRSHAVFTIYLGVKHAALDIRESVINIVDLAGSECFGKTGSTVGSDVQFEGKFINESLAALKRVINAMACGQKYIPFRDSVITTFLKKALNPQSYLTLLGCVSPYQDDYGETLSTVLFVSGAKQLKRTPQLNAVITDFQKSKTPVKTPNSMLNSTNALFKRPASMSTGFPHKRSYPFNPKMMSVQPKKLSFAATSSEYHRFERCSVPSTSNSTTKKTFQQKRLVSLGGIRPKAVTSLFPMPLTPSRRLIENLLNNKNNESNESINFCDASTSSALDVSSTSRHRFSTATPNVEIQSHLGKLVNILTGPAFEMLSSEVEKRIARNSNLKLRPNQIMESFHAVLNELLVQDATMPLKNHVELSPLNEQSNESGIALASTSKQSKTMFNDESMAEKRTPASIAIDVNHDEKQIIIEVTTKADDPLPAVSPVPPPNPLPSVPLTPNSEGNPNQTENNFNAGLQLVNPQQLLQSPEVSQTLSKDEVDVTINKSYETAINDWMTVQLTPIVAKLHPIETERTPIGKIRLRKTIPDDAMDDNSAYEIVMVNKDRALPQVKKVQFRPLEKICMNTNGDNDCRTVNAPVVPTAYPLGANSPIACKMTASKHWFPMAPNMIQQRLNVLQDYNRCLTMQNVARLSAAAKASQQGNRPTKRKPPISQSAAVTKTILQILNVGTQKDLALLATIGPKTAAVILQNRTDRGQFECIDALLRVPSWSKKKHRRFLELNVQC